jgi:hypothetical protein
MANEFDTPNFGIENTMELGTGNTELIDNFLGSETVTESPDNLEPIVKSVAPAELPKKPEVAKGKEIVQVEDGKEPSPQDIIKNFLGDGETEDEITPPDEKPESINEDTPVEENASPFPTLAKELFKLGVFTKEEGEEEVEIGTGQEFLERFKAEKQKGAIEVVNNFIGQFGEDYQNAFDAIFVKGANPKEYFGVYNNIVEFAGLDITGESNEANQIAVVKQGLLDQGFEPDDITTEIERLKNYGDLEAVATKHHKVLVKKETLKLQQIEQQAEVELRQKTAYKNQYIQNVNTILQEKLKAKEFDGIPVSPKLVNELQDFLLIDKWKTANGETLTDFDRAILDMKKPENHAIKVKLALLLKIMEKDPTLSTIQRTGISKKSDELFADLARQTSKTKTSSNAKTTNSWFQ